MHDGDSGLYRGSKIGEPRKRKCRDVSGAKTIASTTDRRWLLRTKIGKQTSEETEDSPTERGKQQRLRRACRQRDNFAILIQPTILEAMNLKKTKGPSAVIYTDRPAWSANAQGLLRTCAT